MLRDVQLQSRCSHREPCQRPALEAAWPKGKR